MKRPFLQGMFFIATLKYSRLNYFNIFFVYGVLHYYYMSSWTYMFSFLCNIQPFNKACRKIKPLQHFCHSREGSTCKNFMNHNLPMRHNHIHIKKSSAATSHPNKIYQSYTLYRSLDFLCTYGSNI